MAKNKRKSKKRNQEKVELKNLTSSQKKKIEKQAKWLFAVLLLILIIFLGAMFISKKSKTFKYEGMKFEKIKKGEVQFYYSPIRIEKPYVTIVNGEKRSFKEVIEYGLLLRNDPRKLNVPELKAKFNGVVYVSLDPKLKCEDMGISLINFGRFLGAFKINAKSAVSEKEEASDNLPYVTCENKSEDSTVIMLKQANKTEIVQKRDCYIINVANCEVLEGTESFMLAVIKSWWKA